MSDIIKPQSDKEIIKQQDEIIGRLTRENEYLKDAASRRNDWLHKAKKDAGFTSAVSFDFIWDKVLAAYLTPNTHK